MSFDPICFACANDVAERAGVHVEPAENDIPKVFINGTIPVSKTEYPAELVYESATERFHAYLKIKCQGSSALAYPKKNFTVKLYEDENRETKLKKVFKDWKVPAHKYCLKANYIDHTHARNIVSARLWHQTVQSRSDYDSLPAEMRSSPKNGAVDGFPVRLYTNGTYQGVYTWNIPKDAWTWGMDEDNPNHVLLCAETNINTPNPCNFTALWDGVSGNHWTVEVGTNGAAVQTALNNLIDCVMQSDDAAFKANIGNYLDVQSAMDYIIHMTILAAPDNVAKNLLLASYDGVKWYCGAYDMDATFGMDAGGSATVAASSGWPWNDPDSIGLWSRIKTCFKEELMQRYRQLTTSVYAESNMIALFEKFMDVIGDERYGEDVEIYPNIPVAAGNIKKLRDFINERSWYVEGRFCPPVVPMTSGVVTDNYGYEMTIDGRMVTLVPPENPPAACYIPLSGRKDYLHEGDRVRVVLEAIDNSMLNGDIVLSCGQGNVTKNFKLGPGLHANMRYWDHTTTIDGEYTLWNILLNAAKNTAFKIKLYINDVLYL